MSGFELACWLLAVALLVAIALACFARAQMHQAKAEVYQEFADTFGALASTSRIRDRRRQKLLRRAAFVRLALIDPLVRDGLRAALEDADAHYERQAARG